MSLQDTIRNVISAAKSLAPVIEALTGTTFVGPAVLAAQALITLMDGLKETAGASQEELQATRDELEARINAHVTSTANRLEGE